jgi:hypothetical protein
MVSTEGQSVDSTWAMLLGRGPAKSDIALVLALVTLRVRRRLARQHCFVSNRPPVHHHKIARTQDRLTNQAQVPRRSKSLVIFEIIENKVRKSFGEITTIVRT